MKPSNTIDFGGHLLWCLTGTDSKPAAQALARGEVSGLYISKERYVEISSLSFLARFEGLRVLAINEAPGLDLAPLAQLTDLEFLSIGSGTTGSFDLGVLQGLRHLRVAIRPDFGLPRQPLPQLGTLATWSLPWTDLSALGGWQALRSLELVQARKLLSLKGLEQCHGLTSLSVAYAPALQHVDALAVLASLQELEFRNTKKIADYRSLAKLTRLRKLMLEKSAPLPSLAPLSGAKALQHLVIRDTPIEDADLTPLLRLPRLSHVYLDERRDYQPALGELKKRVAARQASATQ